jgi:hypothetical protein
VVIFVRQFNASLQNHQLPGNTGKYGEVRLLNFHDSGADSKIKIAGGVICRGRINVQFGGASAGPFAGFKIFGFINVFGHFSKKLSPKNVS